MTLNLETVYPIVAPVIKTTPKVACPPGQTCYISSCSYEYCTSDGPAVTCPSTHFLNAESGQCEPLPVGVKTWYYGYPCDVDIYWYDNFGLTRGEDGLPTDWPPPDFSYVSSSWGPSGVLGGTRAGDIIMPDMRPPWFFRNCLEVCISSCPGYEEVVLPIQTICWYQHVLFNIGIGGLLWQSVIIRTPGQLGEAPPALPEVPSVIPPILLKQFYTLGFCPVEP